MDKRLSNWIAGAVAVVWVLSFLADIFLKDYDPSPFVHLAMMTVGGAAVGRNIFNGKDGS